MAIKVLRGSQVNAPEWFHHQGGLVSEKRSSVGEGKAPMYSPHPSPRQPVTSLPPLSPDSEPILDQQQWGCLTSASVCGPL